MVQSIKRRPQKWRLEVLRVALVRVRQGPAIVADDRAQVVQNKVPPQHSTHFSKWHRTFLVVGSPSGWPWAIHANFLLMWCELTLVSCFIVSPICFRNYFITLTLYFVFIIFFLEVYFHYSFVSSLFLSYTYNFTLYCFITVIWW